MRQTLVEIGALLQFVGEGVADYLVARIQLQREQEPLTYGVAEFPTAVRIVDGGVVDCVGKGPVGVAKPAREFGAVELYKRRIVVGVSENARAEVVPPEPASDRLEGFPHQRLSLLPFSVRRHRTHAYRWTQMGKRVIRLLDCA